MPAAVRRLAPVLALLLVIACPAPSLAQSDDLKEANQLFKQGQLDRALDRVNAYLGRNPKDARGRFLKGIILTEQGKPNDAIKVFTELTQEFPELPEPYNNLAVLYASQGQYEKARVALEMAIRTHPSYATAHENLGDIYAKMASQAYDKALQLDKTNTTAQTKLNLIKDLFPGNRAGPASGKAAAPTQVATASAPRVQPADTKAAAPKAVDAPPYAKDAAKAAPEKPAPAKATSAAKDAVVASAGTAKPAGPKDAAGRPEQSKAAAAQNPQEVIDTLMQWAQAWSGNDVPRYLAHYSPDFHPPEGMNRSEWEAQRRARIAAPRQIQVEITSPKVKFSDARRATVVFRQRYESGSLKLLNVKTMVMVKAGSRWLIEEEHSGS